MTIDELAKTVIEKRWQRMSDKWEDVLDAVERDSQAWLGFHVARFDEEVEAMRRTLHATVLGPKKTDGWVQISLDEEMARLDAGS